MDSKDGRARHAFLSSAVRSILRIRVPLLLAFLAVTLFLSIKLRNMRQADPMKSMYPDGHPFLPALDAIENQAEPGSLSR